MSILTGKEPMLLSGAKPVDIFGPKAFLSLAKRSRQERSSVADVLPANQIQPEGCFPRPRSK